jgi:hypothetical protein
MREVLVACVAPVVVLIALHLAACAAACAAASQPDTEYPETADTDVPLDLNSAGYEELLALPGLSDSAARAIVGRRAALGCIRSFDDLIGVGGLDPLDLARIRPYVTLGAGCVGTGTAIGATFALWNAGGTAGSAAGKRGRAGDLSVARRPARLRLRARQGRLDAHGGLILGFAGLSVTAGETRGRPAHPIAVEIGRGAMTLDGPAAARPMPSAGRTGQRAHGSLQITTGAGERLRGVGLEIYRRQRAVFFAGEFVGAWDAEPFPLASASVRLLGARRVELWGGAAGWGRRGGMPRGGCGYVGAWWKSGSVRGSAGLAARGSGAAWLVELSARPSRGRRLDLCVAGRSVGYENPAGLSVFRSAGHPSVASRLALAQRAGPLGEISYEEVVESEGDGPSFKRAVGLRRRLEEGLWTECEVRAYRDAGGAWKPRSTLKLLWRPSRRGRSELLCKSGGRGSSLVGWRSSLASGSWEVEWGGFSFRTPKSLYFYESEIAGLSSIKALKGEGLGWYLCIRLEPLEGAGPLWFVGSAELKVRTVLERGSLPCGTFVGLQVSRR